MHTQRKIVGCQPLTIGTTLVSQKILKTEYLGCTLAAATTIN